MGCDFYIYKVLEIRDLQNKIIDIIELNRDKRYYPNNIWRSNSFDSNDSNYQVNISKRKDEYLIKHYATKNIILFENNIWKNTATERKYIGLINFDINNISSIIKIEYCEERE
jgi:hypothetical protein